MSWDGIKIDFGKINGWKFITIILAAVLMMFMWTGYGHVKQLEDQAIIISDYQKDSVTFTRTINELGQEVATQTSMVTIKTKQVQKLLLDSSNLASINHQIKIQSQTKIRNIVAGYDKQLANSGYNEGIDFDIIQPDPYEDFITDDSTGHEYVALGTKFSVNTQWYNLEGEILKEGVNINSIGIVNDDEYNLGYEKWKLKNMFKKRPLVLEVTHKNPYTSTAKLKNIHLEDPKKWYQTTAFKVGIGAVIGATAVMIAN